MKIGKQDQPALRQKVLTKWFWVLFTTFIGVSLILTGELFSAWRIGAMILLALFWEYYFYLIPRMLFDVLQDDRIIYSSIKMAALVVAACIFSTGVCVFSFGAERSTIYVCLVMSFICPFSLAPIVVLTFSRMSKLIRNKHDQLNKSIKELDKAVANVKELTGLIPICAYCKKIRDDEGFWGELESYIQEHSKTLVSHCLCPDCSQ